MWRLLLRDSRVIGFQKTVGGVSLYSRDGYAFSGQPIEFDNAYPETPLRTLSGRRIFHGDVVEVRPSPGSEFEERVVLADAHGTLQFGRRDSMALKPIESSWEDLRKVPVRRRVDSIFARAYFRKLYDGAVGALLERDGSHWPTASRMAAAVVGGGAISVWLQMATSGQVGPFSVLGGSLLAVSVLAWFESHHGSVHLRRAFLLRVAHRAALINAPVLSLIYFVFSALGATGLPHELDARLVGTGGAAFGGYLATYALTAIAGNLVHHYLPSSE